MCENEPHPVVQEAAFIEDPEQWAGLQLHMTALQQQVFNEDLRMVIYKNKQQ